MKTGERPEAMGYRINIALFSYFVEFSEHGYFCQSLEQVNYRYGKAILACPASVLRTKD
jgi:hypothetical protein